MTMPKFEPVAWLRDTLDGGLSTMTDCCTNVVKEIWLKANPKNVERYTAPLYTLDQLTKAYEAGKRDAITEADRLSDENDQLRAHVNRLREEINDYAYDECGFCIDPDAAEVRDATPEQSLAEYRNKVIEECATRCDPKEEFAYSRNYLSGITECAEAIRAMKDQP